MDWGVSYAFRQSGNRDLRRISGVDSIAVHAVSKLLVEEANF
jgi:hypothetical protein